MTITKSYYFIPDFSESTKFEKVEMNGDKPNFEKYDHDACDRAAFASLEVDIHHNQVVRLVNNVSEHWTECDDFVLKINWGTTDNYAIAAFASALNAFEGDDFSL